MIDNKMNRYPKVLDLCKYFIIFKLRVLEVAVMSTRFKFFLINSLSRYRFSRDSGFALPLAIMVGGCIMIVGLAVVIQAQGNQSKVVSQDLTAKANSIAEAGVTQYINFLNSNRALLTYPDCNADRDASGACPDSGTTIKSWSLASNIIPSTRLEGGNACTNATATTSNASSTSASTVSSTWANANNTNGWKTLNGGQYKLVGYKYTPSATANTAPGVAVLGIQGTVGDANGNQGKAQIHLTMQVNTIAGGLAPIPQTNTPGLWARSFSTAANVHANVLDSSGCTSGNTAFPASKVALIPIQPIGALPNGNKTPPLSTTVGVVTKDTNGTPFPPLPYYPTVTEFTGILSSKVNTLSSCASKTAYPANGDKDADGNTYNSASPPTTAKVYKYRITGDCTLPSGVTFGTSTGQDRIIMYIDANLDIGNNAKIGVSGSNSTKVSWLLKTDDLDLGGNSQIGTAAPDAATSKNWAFFLYNSSGGTVSLRGTPDYYGFIFAPYANADLRGNPKIAGALWVNSYQTNGAPLKFSRLFLRAISIRYFLTSTQIRERMFLPLRPRIFSVIPRIIVNSPLDLLLLLRPAPMRVVQSQLIRVPLLATTQPQLVRFPLLLVSALQILLQ